jgi:thymidylate kinase
MPLFIFEGMDCVGKSTIQKEVSAFFKKTLRTSISTKQPYSENLRKFVLEECQEGISRHLAFSADSINHINSLIFPSLKEKQTVFCDRWYPISEYIYREFTLDSDLKFLDISTCGLIADIIFILSPPKSVVKNRLIRKFQKDGHLNSIETRLYYDQGYFDHVYNSYLNADTHPFLNKLGKEIFVLKEENYNTNLNTIFTLLLTS